MQSIIVLLVQKVL